MNDLRAAAQQALEALELCRDWPGAYDECSSAITALRAALAQQEQEPVAWIQPDHLQKARQAPFLCLVEPTKRMSVFVPIYTHPPRRETEQEPVVVRAEALDLIAEAAEVLDKVRVSCDAWEKYGLRDFLPDELAGTAGMLRDGSALTHPPRREWVPLTEEETAQVLGFGDYTARSTEVTLTVIARAIEAALKERNT